MAAAATLLATTEVGPLPSGGEGKDRQTCPTVTEEGTRYVQSPVPCVPSVPSVLSIPSLVLNTKTCSSLLIDSVLVAEESIPEESIPPSQVAPIASGRSCLALQNSVL